jgi:hypothetical protein
MCKKGAIKLMMFTTCADLHIGSSLLVFHAAVVSLRFNNFLFVLNFKLFLDLKVCIDHQSIFNVVLKVKKYLKPFKYKMNLKNEYLISHGQLFQS